MSETLAFMSPDGSLRASPEQVIRTPSVIAVLFIIFAILVALILGIAAYWHELEKAKKLHPNAAGYGKWYFKPGYRVIISIVSGIGVLLLMILGIVVIFVVPGPLLAQSYLKYKGEQTLTDLESTDINLAKQRARDLEVR